MEPRQFTREIFASAPPSEHNPYQYSYFQQPQTFSEVPAELGDDFIIGKKELKEQGLANQKAQVCLLLDVSRSMQNPNKFFCDEYKIDRVQQTINRILALAFSFDDNRQIEVIPFAGRAYDIITINRSNYKFATQLVLESLKESTEAHYPNIYYNLKEDTNYAAAIRAVRKKFFNEEGPRQKIQPSNQLPVFAILITDDNHNDEEEEAEKQFKYASYQNIFIKCFGLMGTQSQEQFEFLSNMDSLKSEKETDKKSNNKTSHSFFDCCFSTDVVEPDCSFCIDNVNFMMVLDPNKISMKDLLREFRGWLEEAYSKGISKIPPKIDKGADYKNEGRTIKI